MKRKLLAGLVGALAVAVALPAFAVDFKVNGFLKTRFVADNYSNGSGPTTNFADDSEIGRFIEQRMRTKFTVGVNEYLAFVYFGEIDLYFGDAAFAVGRNQGGAIQADTINLETKNLYMDIKVPETAISGRIGVQGWADNWSGYFLLSDVAGVSVNYSFEQGTVSGLYAKLWEGSKTNEDDVDLWGLMLGMKPMGDFKFGIDVFYANDNDPNFSTATPQPPGTANPGTTLIGIQGLYDRADLYWAGVNASYDLKGSFPVNFSGWAMYNGGELRDIGGEDVDVAGWALDLMAKFKLGGAGLGLEGFYVSGDNDSDEIKMPLSTAVWSGSSSTYGAAGPDLPFYKSGLMILLYDPMTGNGSQSAVRDPQNAFLGLWGVVLTGSYSPETMKALYLKGAVGYINSVEDAVKRSGTTFTETGGETNLGTEVNARVGYKIATNFDLSLNGAYVFLGDFYDDWSRDSDGQPSDPDDPYLVYVMAQLDF